MDDWELMENVEYVLKTFHNAGWLVVIFTNQSGLKTSKKLTIEDFKDKLNNISNSLNINIKFLASLDKDYFRKPMLGMWEILETKFPYIKDTNKFYCGDAFNPNDKLKASDLRFAWHANIPFIYPSKIFITNFNIQNLDVIRDKSHKDFLEVVLKLKPTVRSFILKNYY